MKLDFSSDNSAIAFAEEDIATQNGHTDNGSDKEDNKNLRAGIKAAQRGDRAEARQMLMRVTETDPNNESAWLWLASISEYPEELLIFLNNVLDINPENERAIEWAKATKSLLAKTFVQRGIEANQQDQKNLARQCFMQAIVHDNRNEMAWLWLASVTDASEEKIAHFHRVLEINPENETARESIRSAKEKMIRSTFEKAESAFEENDRERAEYYLNELFEFDPQHEDGWFLKADMSESFEDRMSCFEKMLEFDPENERAREAVNRAREEKAAEFFAKANDAANEGDRVQANEFITEVFNYNPQHEDAWILKSRMTDSFEGKIECFEKILEFNPDNETAQAGVKLRAMLNGTAPKMEEAVTFPNEEFDEDLSEAEASAESFEDNAAAEDSGEESAQFADQSNDYSEENEEPETEQMIEEDDEQMIEEDAVSVASFDEEMVSASDETQEFSYFAESENSEEAEMPEAEFSPETEDFAAEDNSEDEYSFENESDAPEAEEAENHSEYSFEENQPEREVSEFEKPEDVFAEYAENYGVQNFSNNGDGQETFAAENFAQTEMSTNGFHAEEMPETENEEEMAAVEEMPAMSEEKPQGEQKACPFCTQENEVQAFVCRSCRSLLTLSDLEMILAYTEADTDVLRSAVKHLEVENAQRGLEAEELVTLAIGHINLKNLRKGLECLQRAAKLDPNNVVIESQANSLAIRLAEIEEKESVHSSMPKDRTIMVVDDSATVRKLISGKLEKCGHIVITAVDGMDAMAKLSEVVPDLILLDITMPRMDGYQVCKLIRGSDVTKDVPVVMISGKDGFFDKVRGRMAGTTGYITKPFGPETLMKMLDTYLVQ